MNVGKLTQARVTASNLHVRVDCITSTAYTLTVVDTDTLTVVDTGTLTVVDTDTHGRGH